MSEPLSIGDGILPVLKIVAIQNGKGERLRRGAIGQCHLNRYAFQDMKIDTQMFVVVLILGFLCAPLPFSILP